MYFWNCRWSVCYQITIQKEFGDAELHNAYLHLAERKLHLNNTMYFKFFFNMK